MTTLVLERTLAAPIATGFDDVTRNEKLLEWWGPEGMTVPEGALDFTRPGPGPRSPWSSVTQNANPGGPAGLSRTVTAEGVEDNGGANPVSRHIVVSAATREAAVEMARGCPILDEGTVEITEILSM